MTEKEMIELTKQAALIIGRLEQQAEAMQQRFDEAARRLNASAEQAHEQMRKLLDEAAAHSHASVKAALDKEAENFRHEMQQTFRAMHQSGDRLQQTLAQSGGKTRRLVFVSLAALACCGVLVVAGSSFVLWQNIKQVEQLQARIHQLELLSQIPLGNCDGQICLKVDSKTKRWGKQGDYVLIESSPRY